MNLKLEHLRKVVNRVKGEEKHLDALRHEVKRLFGPIIDTDVAIGALAEAVNDRVEVMKRTGRKYDHAKVSVVAKFASSNDPYVRKMVVNLLPEHMLGRFMFDNSETVRLAVASRASLSEVKKMVKKYMNDDQLLTIYKGRKKLLESGLPKPKVVDEPFDMYGEERLGDAVKQPPVPELSDEWYREKAFKLLQDYGQNIEYNWEEIAVDNLCRHTKATSGVEIDREKLLKELQKLITDKEDLALERSALKEVIEYLNSDDEDVISESLDVVDPIAELLSTKFNQGEYIDGFNALYSVYEADVPNGIKKFRIGEGYSSKPMSVPIKATIPHKGPITESDELAFDTYVDLWNERQQLMGEPIKINWTQNPMDERTVSFTVELK